jgi:hypothetical protein
MINKTFIELETHPYMLHFNFLKFKFPKLILLFPSCIIDVNKFICIIVETCT